MPENENSNNTILKTALYEAIIAGNENNAAAYIKRVANLNSPVVAKAVLRAVERGNLSMLRLLIEAGMNPNIKTHDTGLTPLMWSARYGEIACMQYLLDCGADIETFDTGEYGSNMNALMKAAASGDLAAVRLLVEHGAKVNAHLEGEWTALMWAVRDGNSECVQYLIDAGAEINYLSARRITALGLAERYRNQEVIKLLRGYGAISSQISLWKRFLQWLFFPLILARKERYSVRWQRQHLDHFRQN